VASVSGVERLGAYDLITALDRFGPTDPRPGQFYMLAAARRWGGGGDERPYLPRAFSYARARVEADGVALDFLLEAVGPGTERLSELGPDEDLALVGPLGIGFRPPAEGTRPLLVGGGIGAAPLLCWQEELAAASEAGAPEADPSEDARSAAAEAPEADPSAAGPARLPERCPCPGGRALRPRSSGGHRRRLGRPPGARNGTARRGAGRRPACDRLRMRPAADARSGPRTLRRTRYSRSTRHGIGNGVRIWSLFWLRRSNT
jgi:hypothetical protein